MSTLNIYCPEGASIFTRHVDYSEISEQIAGSMKYAWEARLLQEFGERDGIEAPETLGDGAWRLTGTGVSPKSGTQYYIYTEVNE